VLPRRISFVSPEGISGKDEGTDAEKGKAAGLGDRLRCIGDNDFAVGTVAAAVPTISIIATTTATTARETTVVSDAEAIEASVAIAAGTVTDAPTTAPALAARPDWATGTAAPSTDSTAAEPRELPCGKEVAAAAVTARVARPGTNGAGGAAGTAGTAGEGIVAAVAAPSTSASNDILTPAIVPNRACAADAGVAIAAATVGYAVAASATGTNKIAICPGNERRVGVARVSATTPSPAARRAATVGATTTTATAPALDSYVGLLVACGDCNAARSCGCQHQDLSLRHCADFQDQNERDSFHPESSHRTTHHRFAKHDLSPWTAADRSDTASRFTRPGPTPRTNTSSQTEKESVFKKWGKQA
jgi:hypothetical protein